MQVVDVGRLCGGRAADFASRAGESVAADGGGPLLPTRACPLVRVAMIIRTLGPNFSAGFYWKFHGGPHQTTSELGGPRILTNRVLIWTATTTAAVVEHALNVFDAI